MLVFICYYLCNFVVRDIKIDVYLESLRKINFNLVTFLVSEIFQKTNLTINNKVVIYLDLWQKIYERYLFITEN